MNPIKPAIGRIVIYTVHQDDKSFDGNGRNTNPEANGGKLLELAADIVRVWTDTCVNLKVKNDGPTDVWKTSATYDPDGKPGTWRWMDYQLGQAAKTEAALNEPRLGCATTGELLAELTARCEVNGTAAYRTTSRLMNPESGNPALGVIVSRERVEIPTMVDNASREAIAAGAVYAFMGWLTSRNAVSGPFSGHHEASSAAKLSAAFIQAQGWDNSNPDIPKWRDPDETDKEYFARLDREHPLDSPEHAFANVDEPGGAEPLSYPRSITGHEVNAANRGITIAADEPGAGGASHRYLVKIGGDLADGHFGGDVQEVSFQNGPVNEDGNGLNGTTHEVLLTIVADRLQAFQDGPYASKHNAAALAQVLAARENLHQRTRERQARGVEGTHKV